MPASVRHPLAGRTAHTLAGGGPRAAIVSPHPVRTGT